jgi:hypothetical protein
MVPTGSLLCQQTQNHEPDESSHTLTMSTSFLSLAQEIQLWLPAESVSQNITRIVTIGLTMTTAGVAIFACGEKAFDLSL